MNDLLFLPHATESGCYLAGDYVITHESRGYVAAYCPPWESAELTGPTDLFRAMQVCNEHHLSVNDSF